MAHGKESDRNFNLCTDISNTQLLTSSHSEFSCGTLHASIGSCGIYLHDDCVQGMTAKAAFRAVAGPDAAELDCDRLLRVLQLMHPHFSRLALVELCTDLHAVLGDDKKTVRLCM